MKAINFKKVEKLRQKESWKTIASAMGVSPTTLRRHYYTWKEQEAAEAEAKKAKAKAEAETETVAKDEPSTTETVTETETKRRVTTITADDNGWREDWPSYELIPLAEALVGAVEDLEIGQRKTTVFLKHPSLRKQIITFYGSANAPGAFSPHFRKSDKGIRVDTLGLLNVRMKDLDAEQIAAIGLRVLKRAGLIH